MKRRAQSPLARHRARRARSGFVRVEVNIRKEDVRLLRAVAKTLSDPARAAEARKLRRDFDEPPAPGLKALLAAAPLSGIELGRDADDTGRDVDL